jgi:hypothetical protein
MDRLRELDKLLRESFAADDWATSQALRLIRDELGDIHAAFTALRLFLGKDFRPPAPVSEPAPAGGSLVGAARAAAVLAECEADLAGETCPHDNDGDGDCGRPSCSRCNPGLRGEAEAIDRIIQRIRHEVVVQRAEALAHTPKYLPLRSGDGGAMMSEHVAGEWLHIDAVRDLLGIVDDPFARRPRPERPSPPTPAATDAVRTAAEAVAQGVEIISDTRWYRVPRARIHALKAALAAAPGQGEARPETEVLCRSRDAAREWVNAGSPGEGEHWHAMAALAKVWDLKPSMALPTPSPAPAAGVPEELARIVRRAVLMWRQVDRKHVVVSLGTEQALDALVVYLDAHPEVLSPSPGGAGVVSPAMTVANGAPPCPACGAITVRSGDKYKCLNCGNTMDRDGGGSPVPAPKPAPTDPALARPSEPAQEPQP